MSEIIANAKGSYGGEIFTITLFSPEKAFPESEEYKCHFAIKGKGISYNDRAIGFDSMQSLILSLKMIGSFIGDNDDIDTSAIAWDGGPIKFPSFEDK
jgi:hypothetical protein